MVFCFSVHHNLSSWGFQRSVVKFKRSVYLGLHREVEGKEGKVQEVQSDEDVWD